jgi:GTP-binding protein
MAKQTLPLVAICGRPNVGKSTLFNRITGKARAIVHDEEGITRDRYFGTAEWHGRKFRVVDTGGIVENPIDPVVKQMQEQVRVALNEAKVIIFVVDGQQPLTRVDFEVQAELFKYNKPVLLAVNKIDNHRMQENRFEYYELGMGEPHAISSGHGIGVDDLMGVLVEKLPPPNAAEVEPEEDPTVTKVAVIGKPNVGKSSFINAILNEPRTIVDDRPGTTRDAIDIEFHWKDKDYLLIDTAGMRKKAGIQKMVEQFSVSRSLRSIRRADICMVMIDAVEGISEQDKRIIGFCLENGTPMILVWTKWDLVENREQRFKALEDEMDLKMPQVHHVPRLTISNLTRQRLFTSFELIDQVAAEAQKRIPTADLNKLIEDIKAKHNPPNVKGRHAKILYATQASVKPTVFVLFVNQARLFHFSYLRFIENQLRARYGFKGVPIRSELREGKPRE